MRTKRNQLLEDVSNLFQKSEIEKRRSGEGDMMKKILLIKALKFVVLIVIFFTSCGPDAPKNIPVESESKSKISVPEFNADSALSYVKKQVDFGPRIPNTKAHDLCAAYLVKFFESHGMKIHQQKGSLQAYDGKTLNFNNITAQYQPEKTNRVMISAHWDTRPWADQDSKEPQKSFDGANDGASGIGIMMELARVISKEKLNVGVDFVLFDVEDYGKPEFEDSYCYGSQYWAKNFPLQYKPFYGINLDMVGDVNAKFTYEGVSVQTAKSVLDKVWRSAHGLGYAQYFSYEETSAITDDHAYVNRYTSIPCIDLIDRSTPGFARTWHKHDDNIENISRQTLKAVGQTLLYVLHIE
ncbi:MAG: M28 family peptidase [Bacteroidetes bacterium]|nr:M28 family peptidase [Bacteroidota bacterium]